MTAGPVDVVRAPNARIPAPSMTYWMRVEPDARDDDLTEPLRARIRDPLWMLTRQWQLGEFQGADAGSPAFVEIAETRGRLTGWRTGNGPVSPLAAGALESQVEREPLTPDLATRIELGQTFESLLIEHGMGNYIAAFRAEPAYAIAQAPLDSADPTEVQLRRVCAGRGMDGVALHQAARAASPVLPANPSIPAADSGPVLAAVNDFLEWVAATFGEIAVKDPVAWNPTRLEYQLALTATAPDGTDATLSATPLSDGLLDWPAFDLATPGTPAGAPVHAPAGKPAQTRTVMPTHVHFRGAPNARFWDFEVAGTDLGAIVPDRRDLARMALTEFALLHANDWFVVPIDLSPGTLYQCVQLVVHDVFDVLTVIDRADREGVLQGRWSLFTTSRADGAGTADFFLFPPTVASAIQISSPVEEVQFARDEMANMVWGIERSTENQVGEPWPGNERAIAHDGAAAPPNASGSVDVPLRYRIESPVPEYWIPFLPVSLDPARGLVALERAAMLRGDGTPVDPAGRILNPTSLAVGEPYRIQEEEIPRVGIRVRRVICRARWLDGTTMLWQMRRTAPGSGETSSALQFDVAEPNA